MYPEWNCTDAWDVANVVLFTHFCCWLTLITPHVVVDVQGIIVWNIYHL